MRLGEKQRMIIGVALNAYRGPSHSLAESYGSIVVK